MSLKNKTRFLFIVALCTAFFYACTNDVDLNNVSNEMLIDQSLVLPIGKSNITVEKILEQIADSSIFTEGKEIYFQISQKDSFYYHDTEIFGNYVWSQSRALTPTTVPTNSFTVSANHFWDFQLNSNTDFERVDSAVLNNASFKLKLSVSGVTNLSPENVNVILTFGNRIKKSDGSEFIYYFKPKAFNTQEIVSLNDCVLDFTTAGNDVENGLPVNAIFEFTTNGSPFIVSPGASAGLDLAIEDVDYKIAYGKYEADITLSNKIMTVDADLSTQFKNGVLKFANPKILVTAQSNVGTKLEFSIDYIRAYPANEPSNYVEADFNGSPKITVDIPKPSSIGSYVSKVFDEFNKDYGKTDQLFQDDNGLLPDIFEYQFRVKSIHDANDKTPDYITQDAIIRAEAWAKLPFYLKEGSWYEINDTIFDISKEINELLDEVKLEKAALNLNIENALPIAGECSLKFLDEFNNPIATDIKSNYEIAAATVYPKGSEQEGEVESPKNQLITISLNETQTDVLRITDKIQIIFRIDAGDDLTPIHFTKDNYFGVKLGLFVKAKHTVEI